MSERIQKKDKLIYSFLFDEAITYEINLNDFCNYENRSTFRNELREVIIKGGKNIIEDRIIHRENDTIWRLEIK